MKRVYHVYVLASRTRVLYVGVTNDLLRRVIEHREKQVSGFTSRYKIDRLVHMEPFGDIRAAIGREKEVKGWSRAKNVALMPEQFIPRALRMGEKEKADSSRRSE